MKIIDYPIFSIGQRLFSKRCIFDGVPNWLVIERVERLTDLTVAYYIKYDIPVTAGFEAIAEWVLSQEALIGTL